MKVTKNSILATLAALALSAGTLSAQQDNPQAGGGGQGGQGGGGGRFDPAQMQQRMMDNLKEQFEITDDQEWKAIQPLIQKVTDARRGSMAGMGRGMFGRGPRGGDNANAQGDRPRRGGGGGFFGAPSAEAEALQKAIDAKAPKAELKAALAKYVESRKTKQAELEQAQAELRKVLTARQEAIATLNGLL
jgi:hypothetical protein